jgi:hypothetical protein
MSVWRSERSTGRLHYRNCQNRKVQIDIKKLQMIMTYYRLTSIDWMLNQSSDPCFEELALKPDCQPSKL